MTDLLKQLPEKAQALWNASYEKAKETHTEDRSEKIAWGVLRNKFNKVETTWVARFKDTKDYITVHYVLEASEDSVARSIDGMIYRDFVLTSNKDVFSDFAFKRMTEQINEEGLTGRVDSHKLYHQLKQDGALTQDEIEALLKKADEGITAIKAVYDGSKVTATVAMTPAAYAKAKSFNAASIEARMPNSSLREGVYHQARLMGFVLTDKPDNPDAVATS